MAADPADVRTRASRDVLLTFGTQLITLLLGLVASIALARILGPEDRGIVQVLQVLTSQLAQILSLGMAVSIIYTVASKAGEPREVAGNAFAIAIGIGALAAALLVGFAGPLSDLLLRGEPAAEGLIRLAAPLPFLLLAQSTTLSIFRGAQRFGTYNVLTVIYRTAYVLFVVVALVAFAPTSQTAISAVLLASAVAWILALWMVGRDFGIDLSFDRAISKKIIRFNLVGHVGSILQALTYRLDVFVLAAYGTAREVGIYAVAIAIAQIIWYLPDSIGAVLLSRTPRSTQAVADARIVKASQSLMALMLLAGAIGVALAPVAVPFLFGDRFRDSVVPLVILVPGVIALGLWKIIIADLAARGFPRFKLYSAAAGAAATVILDFTLIPRFGITGAAVASSFAYAVAALAALFLLRRATGISLKRMVLPTPRIVVDSAKILWRVVSQPKGASHGSTPK